MKTITVQLKSDKDAQLLMDILRTAKFQSEVETFQEDETISDEELQMLNERVEQYKKDPSKGKDLQEIKKKYGI
jgi:hypothetical protein